MLCSGSLAGGCALCDDARTRLLGWWARTAGQDCLEKTLAEAEEADGRRDRRRCAEGMLYIRRKAKHQHEFLTSKKGRTGLGFVLSVAGNFIQHLEDPNFQMSNRDGSRRA